jgi:light-harvesting protein B-800-850 alpha chain
MNQGKIWLVVKPTVGLPLFLGGVTIIALAVHAALLTHTSWFPAYYAGGTKAKSASVESTAPVATVSDSSTIVVAAAPTQLKTQTATSR